MEELIESLLEKTKKAKDKYDLLTQQVSDPTIISNNNEWRKIAKERAMIEDVAQSYEKLKSMYDEYLLCEEEYHKEKDNELKAMFYDEIGDLKHKLEQLCEDVKILLLPKDENDDNNVIVEIRPGAGGEEASLFCSVLAKMYQYYAERQHWKYEVLDLSETELGGIKAITFYIKGKGAYSKLKFESGVHRVQRVPETESQGRIHTSTSTVAVLPEIEDIDVEIDEKDLKIDTYRSSGAGGQHVNKTESAIRITHLPTGIIVACQDERSQIKNREKAMKILRAKIYDFYREQRDKEYKENRKSQVGTGDRSERVRTYNYPQGRVTDHRVNLSSYDLEGVLNGDIEQFIEALTIKDRAEKLANA